MQDYSVLQSTTPYYKVLHSTTLYYKVLLRTTPYFKVLQTTQYYSVLHSTVRGDTLEMQNIMYLQHSEFHLLYLLSIETSK